MIATNRSRAGYIMGWEELLLAFPALLLLVQTWDLLYGITYLKKGKGQVCGT
jgi:hypothetical protein